MESQEIVKMWREGKSEDSIIALLVRQDKITKHEAKVIVERAAYEDWLKQMKGDPK